MSQEKVEVPITGKIVSVNVSAGNAINEGDIICMLESMKMENPILATVGGTVSEIKVSAGQLVQAGDLIAVIEY